MLDGLAAYFHRADVICRCTDDVTSAVARAPVNVTALVLFADEFQPSSVASLFVDLRRERPETLLVVVTATPGLFRSLPSFDGRIPAVTISKPISAWKLLGVIRDAAERTGAGTARTT
jgi:hypothetical protein